jgi:hypothetical protein
MRLRYARGLLDLVTGRPGAALTAFRTAQRLAGLLVAEHALARRLPATRSATRAPPSAPSNTPSTWPNRNSCCSRSCSTPPRACWTAIAG